MKKRNFAVRLGIAAMALTLITTSLSSGTLAKYTESVKATGTLKVAKWNVAARANGTVMTDAGITLADMVGTTNTYTGVASGVVAPGMSGQVEIDLTAAGKTASEAEAFTEVDVYYEVYINVNTAANLPKNMTFSASNSSSGAGSQSVTIDNSTVTANGGKGALLYSGTIANTEKQTGWTAHPVYVKWDWPWEGSYNSNDMTPDQWDVQAGAAGASTNFTFTVVFTQVDPTGSSRHVNGD